MINKLSRYWISFLMPLLAMSGLMLWSLSGSAATKSNCPVGYTLGFFNGVGNTYEDALNGMNALRAIQGDIYQGEDIKYETFYNHTGSSVGATTLQDVAEVFIQRAQELDPSGNLGLTRFYLFWEQYDGQAPGYSNTVVSKSPSLQAFFDAFQNSVVSSSLNVLALLFSNPPTLDDYAQQRTQLDADVDAGRKLLLVAHSQGNLFVNQAYDYVQAIVGSNLVKVVHIAPASPTLRGNYVLADIDLIINALRLKEGANSVPDINLSLPLGQDKSGHLLIGTYLDPARAGRAQIASMLTSALTAMAASQCQLSVTPASSNAKASDTIALTVTLATEPTDPDAVVTYQWTVTGNAGGTVSDATTGMNSTSFETHSKNVTYIASSNAVNTLQDTVTVTAYLGNLLDSTAHRAFGAATATISFDEQSSGRTIYGGPGGYDCGVTTAGGNIPNDDSIAFYLNGTQVFASGYTGCAGIAPVVLPNAKQGDTVRVVVWDEGGHHSGVSGLYMLHDGQYVLVDPGFNRDTPNGQNNGVQYDHSFSIPF